MTAGTVGFDSARLAAVLEPAREHAAVGERVPTLGRVPAPLRWLARLTMRAVYGAAAPLTKRQRAVNESLLTAVQLLSDRVRELSSPPACDAPYQGEMQRMTAALQNKQSWMIWPERVVLYATVLGLRPARTLEIGTFLGGSAQIIAAALDTIGSGSLICVDLNPRVAPENWAKVGHRATMVAEPSPDGLTTAKRIAGGSFDFALIDGDHSYDGVVRDIEGTLPVLADRAYLLFHDAFFHEVAHGIDDMVRKYARELTEVGMMSAEQVPDKANPGVVWGGLRMLRFDRAK